MRTSTIPRIDFPLRTDIPPARRRFVSPTGYWVGAVMSLLGLIAATTWAIMGTIRMNDRIDDFQRIDVPGDQTVLIQRASDQVVYFEGLDVPVLSDVDVSITDPRGDDVILRQYSANLIYDVPGATYSGRAMLTFRAEMRGRYHISTSGASTPFGLVAIGPSIGGNVAATVAGAGLLLLFFGGGGVTLMIVTAVRRSRQRRPAP